MLKYVSKFAMDILPSVVATIIGAYIVNHYIATKPGADAPVAAAVSSADPKPADIRTDAKLSEKSVDVGNLPEPGVKAKGVSEKTLSEKTAAEKPATTEKPAELASIPVETRRHQPAPHEKAVAKAVPAPVQPAVTVAPAITTPNAVAPVEAATPAEEHRDANDLARAAIERLRGAGDASSRTEEATRAPDATRVTDAPRVASAPPVASPVLSVSPVRPLPPPIMVSTPAAETFDSATGSAPIKSSYPAASGDFHRPTPPADIPEASRPLDLRAEAVEPQRREHTSVAEDVLSAAKSVFHAVLPK
jgi:hypothetical protein